MSTDEITGIQALERFYEAFASIAGEIEQRSVDYIRHGPPSLIANFKVASDLDIPWGFIVNNLSIHQSESLVALVADLCDLDEYLVKKGRSGGWPDLIHSTTSAVFMTYPQMRPNRIWTASALPGSSVSQASDAILSRDNQM